MYSNAIITNRYLEESFTFNVLTTEKDDLIEIKRSLIYYDFDAVQKWVYE